MYAELLGRAADEAGLAYWTAWMVQGNHSREELHVQMLASDEYFQTHAGAARGYLEGLYADLLGRGPDPAGLAAWGSLLEAGQLSPAVRRQVMQQMLNSPEYTRARVAEVYQDLLGCAPDPAGWDYWAGRLQGSDSVEEVVQAVVSSPESLDRTR